MKNIRNRAVICTTMAIVGLLFTCVNLPAAQERFNYVLPVAVATFNAEDGSIWEQVNEPGFGNANNFSVVAMAKYKGQLYAMTRNQVQGAEVWRTSESGGWEQVLFPEGETNGIYGNPRINNVWGKIIEFNGKLYFGFSSGLQGNFLGSTGCEIWRYDGTTWEPVISDKRDIDETGSITGIASCANNDGDRKAYITDTSQSWIPDEWAGGTLQITSGTGQYRKFYILGNTANTLTIQQNEVAGTGASPAAEEEYTRCDGRTYNNPYPSYSYTLGAVNIGDSYEIGMGWDESGFGEVWNKTITDMLIHDEKLYVSTGLNYEYGGQVWYSEDGDTWMVTEPANSFGNYHTDGVKYPNGLKPISSSITNLVTFNGILYAGGTGASGDKGSCSRMAKLTESGWELIVDSDVDANITGTNENGFGDGMGCDMDTGNFMPWSFAVFNNKLHAGINSLGGGRIMYTYSASAEDTDFTGGPTWKYSVGGDSAYPKGFDGYTWYANPDWGTVYKNIAMNLFTYRDTLYAGIVTQYVPEYDIVDLQGAGIWLSKDGTNWSKVTGNSFGDPDVVIFEAFANYGGALYVSGSKGASSTPSGLGGAKIFRRVDCVTVTPDDSLAADFQRYTVTGITTPLPEDPTPEGFLAASFLRSGDLDGDGIKEIVVTSTMGASLSYWNQDGAVAVFTWDGINLDSWTQTVIRADFAFANDVLIRDVDADGHVDIMVFDNFLAGAYTRQPAGIYLLKNLGGDITDPANWEKRVIYAKDPKEVGISRYERAKRRASYHQAYFLDLDGDGLEDFATTRLAMEVWQARDTAPTGPNDCANECYDKQYAWSEWFRKETDLVAYPSGFSGPYEIGDGAGFLFDMADIDGDGLLDFLGPQFFITQPGSLVIKGPGDPRGDSFMWFQNPGPEALADDRNTPWERYTIDNWYTSPNPLGKGFMAFPADVTNDGRTEIVFTTHNHQEDKWGYTAEDPLHDPAEPIIWPSGVYYLAIPDDPSSAENWAPVTIDAGNAFWIDRPGGAYSQGSPGHAAVGDVNGDGLADIVVAGDGAGVVYYYEADDFNGCLTFRRTVLYKDPACMSAEVKLYDIDGDGKLEILATVYDTSVAKDSSSGSVFIWKRTVEPECVGDEDCPDGYVCVDGICQKSTLVDLAEFKAMGLFNKVLLKWTTAAEIENAGFNILRADSEGGPYVQINAALIPAKGDPMRGHTYRYLDKDAELGKTYYYKLEDVDLNGTRTLHGPVSASTGFGLFNIR